MAVRRCPKCDCSKAAAVTSPVKPGDYMVCGGCGSVLRLGEDTMPILASEDDIKNSTDRELTELLKFAVEMVRRREQAERRAKLN